jgi:hypothetical protein
MMCFHSELKMTCGGLQYIGRCISFLIHLCLSRLMALFVRQACERIKSHYVIMNFILQIYLMALWTSPVRW